MQDRNDSSQGYHFQDDDPGRVDPWAYQAYRGRMAPAQAGISRRIRRTGGGRAAGAAAWLR